MAQIQRPRKHKNTDLFPPNNCNFVSNFNPKKDFAFCREDPREKSRLMRFAAAFGARANTVSGSNVTGGRN